MKILVFSLEIDGCKRAIKLVKKYNILDSKELKRVKKIMNLLSMMYALHKQKYILFKYTHDFIRILFKKL